MQAAVDHHPHTVDGDRSLGDRRRQNHLAHACSSRTDGRVLFRLAEHAIKRCDHDFRADPAFEPFCHASDLGLSRQEGEDRSLLLRQRLEHGGSHGIFDPLVSRPVPVPHLHRKTPTLADDHRRAREERCNALDIERRRHHEDPQVRPQRRLRIERQGKPEIRIQRPLMKLVEQDGGHPLQLWIIEDHPHEDTFRHHFDAGPRAGPVVEPHAIADRPADSFS